MKSFKNYAKILEESYKIDSENQNIQFKEVAEADHKATQVFIQPLKKAGDKTWFEKDALLGEMAAAYESAGFIVMETKWTQKGRLFIYNLLKEKGIIPVIEQNIAS